MLLLIVGLIVGILMLSRGPLLEGPASKKTKSKAVSAYVDGKPVKSYVKE